MTSYPAEHGFSFPAEWTKHEATWLTWPIPHVVWRERLSDCRAEFTELVATIAKFESVKVIVRDDEALNDAKTRLSKTPNGLSNIAFHPIPVDDCWLRDNGPLFIRNAKGQVALTDWQFNAWGEEYDHWDLDNAVPSLIAKKLDMKRYEVPMILEGGAIDVNNQGVCLTTKSCLLHTNRNAKLSQTQIEQYLSNYLNLKQIIWLEQGFKNDETDGHIDLLARFVNNETILCSVCEDFSDENYEAFQANFAYLETVNDKAFTVIALPIPKRKLFTEGERAALTYANFYMGNGFVVVPTYHDENDAKALSIIAQCCPKHEVIGVLAETMITGGGSFHCVTQQQPKGS